MNCPACFQPLTELQVGRVKVDVCQGGCGGLWLDAFELSQVDDEEGAGTELLLNIERDPTLHVDTGRKRDCPRCPDIKLKKRFFSPRRTVEIDECPGCGGTWLDAGELEKIREEVTAQRLIRHVEARTPGLTMSMIRYLYRARLEETGQNE